MVKQEGFAGVVKTKYYEFDELVLDSGEKLAPVRIAYETYGKLNKKKDNAILICHALSGDSHAAGKHSGSDENTGWWDNVIGPGKAFDTNRYFVICSNVIGGCKGSTGPSSINPKTGELYGTNFPVITLSDIVNAQKELTNYLKINRLFAVAGGSMGAMQSLLWSVLYPEKVARTVVIASTAKSSPQQIAFNEVGRRAIMSDLNWNNGNYYGKELPKDGLSLARMIGHITYLSDESMLNKFGRALNGGKYSYKISDSPEFQVESYLHYKGDSFVKRFDANSYIYITKAIDYFDLAKNGKISLIDAFKNVRSKFLIVAISSDWLYPPEQSREMVMALTANKLDVRYVEIDSSYGHDAFLLETPQLSYAIKNFLSKTNVSDIMVKRQPVKSRSTISDASKIIVKLGCKHLPVVSDNGTLAGVVTAWDIAKAFGSEHKFVDEIMTKKVITAKGSDPIETAVRKMKKYDISSLLVVDGKKKVLGIVTSDVITELFEIK